MSDEYPSQNGLDVFEIDDLPATQRALARVLLRRGELAEAALQHLVQEAAPELDAPSFHAALAELQARQLVLSSASQPPLLRLNLRRKNTRRLTSSIWDALE